MKAKLVACALIVSVASPASAATYYVWSSNRTQKCSVAMRKPLSANRAYSLAGREVGYESRKAATDAIRTIALCKR
jgi:hypothetical protein